MPPPSTSHHRAVLPLLRFALLAAFAFAPPQLSAARWPALDPAALAERSPRIDPEAGAEILLREVLMDDSDEEVTAVEYLVRIKLYSERSLEKLSKIELLYGKNQRIRDIAARTHRPDGTVLELAKKDIFDRDVIKAGDYRQRVKSFAPPGLQVGAIVEYRYTRIYEESTSGLPLSFQDEYPARVVRFRLRPYSHPRLSARMVYFAYPHPPPKPDHEGYYNLEMRDVAARVDEPWRPPAIQTDPTLFLYYTYDREDDPARYWTKRAAELFSASESETKPGKGVRAAVAGLVAASDSPEEKLRKIHDFCRTRIKRRDLDSSGFTEEQRAKFKPNGSPEATLATGHGTTGDINTLFIAMARAAGLDARYAWANDCSYILFDPKMTARFALPDFVAAARVGDAWKYYDPAQIYLPAGMLSWENSGTAILVAEKTAAKIAVTPIPPAEASRRTRTAAFTLQSDGTLEGDVKIRYAGQWEGLVKHSYDGKTTKQLAEIISDSIREDQPLAEVTEVKVENAGNPLQPLQVAYHLRIPEYAERTGSRLFLQPGVFFKGTKALFEATTRKYDIQLRYRYSTEDDIGITLPDNFEFEAPSAPAPLELPQLAQYKVDIEVHRTERRLQYQRRFSSNLVSVPVKYYSGMKAFFDAIHTRDNHVLTLKRTGAVAETGGAAAASNATPAAPSAGGAGR